MLTELKRALLFALVMMVVVGGAYHALMWGVGRALFPDQSSGSLARRADGTVVGSRLIAQAFAGPAYLHPRPSAVDYNAAATGGSNYGPSNPDHLQQLQGRLRHVVAREQATAADVPSEMITASGSGLDPHITPAAAALQIERIAAARAVAPERVRQLVDAHTELPTLRLLGRARINVLDLNLSLDAAFGQPAARK